MRMILMVMKLVLRHTVTILMSHSRQLMMNYTTAMLQKMMTIEDRSDDDNSEDCSDDADTQDHSDDDQLQSETQTAVSTCSSGVSGAELGTREHWHYN